MTAHSAHGNVATPRIRGQPRQDPGLDDSTRHGWEQVADLLDRRESKPVQGRLGQHTLLRELIGAARETVSWDLIACLLTVARFCGNKTELEVANHWCADSACEDLLGVPFEALHHTRPLPQSGHSSRAKDTAFANISSHATKVASGWSLSSVATTSRAPTLKAKPESAGKPRRATRATGAPTAIKSTSAQSVIRRPAADLRSLRRQHRRPPRERKPVARGTMPASARAPGGHPSWKTGVMSSTARISSICRRTISLLERGKYSFSPLTSRSAATVFVSAVIVERRGGHTKGWEGKVGEWVRLWTGGPGT